MLRWIHLDDQVSLTSAADYERGVHYCVVTPGEGNDYLLLDFDGTLFVGGKTFQGAPVPITASFRGLAQTLRTRRLRLWIVTNQHWKNTKVSPRMVEQRLEAGVALLQHAGIPVEGVIASFGDDWYRKPLPGPIDIIMQETGRAERWRSALPETIGNLLRKDGGSLVMIGDAAGRLKDHSSADYQFAWNIGAAFSTEEGLYQVTNLAGCSLGILDPKTRAPFFIKNGGACPIDPPAGPEVVIISGPPGSGKTTLARQLRNYGYVQLSGDEVPGTGAKKETTIINTILNLRPGTSAVIDRVHATPEARAAVIRAAHSTGRSVRGVMTASGSSPTEVAWSWHKMLCRTLAGAESPTKGTYLSSLIYKRLRPAPLTTQEGFDSVITISGAVDLDTCTPYMEGLLRLQTDTSKLGIQE